LSCSLQGIASIRSDLLSQCGRAQASTYGTEKNTLKKFLFIFFYGTGKNDKGFFSIRGLQEHEILS
jgi:hypothetical protein